MMPEIDRRVLAVLTPGARSEFLSTALIAVRTRLSIATVRDILERLRVQGLVRLHGSDPDVWVWVEGQP
jgi:DNA-binding Lrp family transcriptional regulator